MAGVDTWPGIRGVRSSLDFCALDSWRCFSWATWYLLQPNGQWAWAYFKPYPPLRCGSLFLFFVLCCNTSSIFFRKWCCIDGFTIYAAAMLLVQHNWHGPTQVAGADLRGRWRANRMFILRLSTIKSKGFRETAFFPPWRAFSIMLEKVQPGKHATSPVASQSSFTRSLQAVEGHKTSA